MRIFRTMLLFGLVTSAFGQAEKGPEAWRLTAVPIHEVFDLWDPVIIVIEAENISDTTRPLEIYHPWDIQVHKENGEPASFADYGRRNRSLEFEGSISSIVAELDIGGFTMVSVPPGEAMPFRIQLDRWIDMSGGGQYTVRLRRWAGYDMLVPGVEPDPARKPEIIETDPFTVTIGSRTHKSITEFRISEDVLQQRGLPPDFGRRLPTTMGRVMPVE